MARELFHDRDTEYTENGEGEPTATKETPSRQAAVQSQIGNPKSAMRLRVLRASVVNKRGQKSPLRSG
jgi:hypothetical protein